MKKLLLILFLVSPSLAFAAATITGVVLDGAGDPVAGARVMFTSADTPTASTGGVIANTSFRKTSNSAGAVTQDLTEGDWLVTVGLIGQAYYSQFYLAVPSGSGSYDWEDLVTTLGVLWNERITVTDGSTPMLNLTNLTISGGTISSNTPQSATLTFTGGGGSTNMLYAGVGDLDVTNTLKMQNVTASRALVSDASSQVTNSAVTATELGYLSGVTSGVQAQIDGLAAGTGTATFVNGSVITGAPDFDTSAEIAFAVGAVTNVSASLVAGIDAAKIGGGGVSSTEFDYLGSVTSDIQTQIDSKHDGALTANYFPYATDANTLADAAFFQYQPSSALGQLLITNYSATKNEGVDGIFINNTGATIGTNVLGPFRYQFGAAGATDGGIWLGGMDNDGSHATELKFSTLTNTAGTISTLRNVFWNTKTASGGGGWSIITSSSNQVGNAETAANAGVANEWYFRGANGGGLQHVGATPYFNIIESDQATDGKTWQWLYQNTDVYLQAYNAAGTAALNTWEITRSATTTNVTAQTWRADAFTFEGGGVTAPSFSGVGSALTAVDAATGDSATAFFDAGTIEHEYGGLEANVSAYTGLVGIDAGATVEVDTIAEFDTALGLTGTPGATTYLRGDGAWASPGDVTGPGSSTDNTIARYDSTTGKVIQGSVVTISDAGAIAAVDSLTATNAVTAGSFVSQGSGVGVAQLYDSDASNYIEIKAPAVVTTNSISIWPGTNGTPAQVLATAADGQLYWKDDSTGAGSVATDTIWDAAGDVLYGTADNAGARLAIGTAAQFFQVNAGATAPQWSSFSGDITVAAGGAATIQANSVALATDTTGNFVATVADSGAAEVTVTGSGSENAAVTLALAAGITRDTEWDTFAEINAASTDTDAVLDTDIGATVQAYDADLTTWAGVTPGTGVATALGIATNSAGGLTTKEYVDAAAGGGGWTAAVNGTIDTTTSNTLQDVTEMSFSIGADENYMVRWELKVSQGASGQLTFAVNAPSGATIAGTFVATSAAAVVSQHIDAIETSTTVFPATADAVIKIVAYIDNAGTGGTVQLRFRNQNGTTTINIEPGSLMEYRQM